LGPYFPLAEPTIARRLGNLEDLFEAYVDACAPADDEDEDTAE